MPSVGNETSHTFDGLTVRGGLALDGGASGTTYLSREVASNLARYNMVMRAQGYYTETYQRGPISASTIMVTQSVYYQPVGLLAGDVVTNLLSMVQTLASGFSGINMKGGLYSMAGTLLASTGDISAAFGSVGCKTSPLTAPYTITADGVYWVALLCIASTPPVIMRGAPNQSTAGFSTGAIGYSGVQTGQTDLPASATITYSTNSLPFWHGIS